MLTRRDILTRHALWILITENTELLRKDFAHAQTATVADIRQLVAADARVAIYVLDFSVRIVAANVAAETLSPAAKQGAYKYV